MSDPSRGSRQLRPLLPAVPLPPPEAAPSKPCAGQGQKQRKAVACEACRQRKSKCSGERPICSGCIKNKTNCQYFRQPTETASQALKRKHDELQQFISPYEELFELLRSLPEQEAQDVLRRVRSGIDITTVLNQVKAGNLLLQMALVPETRFRYEFPYVSAMPTDLLSHNPYLNSVIYEAASLYSRPQQHIPAAGQLPASSHRDASAEYQTAYLKPLHAAEVIEPLISSVKPSLWSTVCSDDALMRDLLKVYLRCEYNFLAAFQKDHFLEDMAAQRHEFCSSLLVNAVLAHACSCYPQLKDRSEYWNPQTLSYRFLAEAKRLWELEAHRAKLTTIQAAVVLNGVHNLCGLDKIGQAYTVQAIALAHKLRLFDRSVRVRSERKRHGRVFTAWMLYNWETLAAYHFLQPPMIKRTPHDQLPDPLTNSLWYGEIWVKYLLNQTLSSTSFGQMLQARSKFRVLMNEICQACFVNGSKITLSQANEFYSRLKKWQADLPEPLKPRSIILPQHFQLHMHYQSLVLTLYDAFTSSVDSDDERSPRRIVANARKYLQTLLRLYYLRHGFSAMDLFLCHPLAVIGFSCLRAIGEQVGEDELEAARSTLFLIAKGLREQSRNHYIAETLFRVIKGQMRPQEAALLMGIADIADDKDGRKQAQIQAVHSQWPASVVDRSDSMEVQSLTKLIEQYADRDAVEDEVRVRFSSASD